MLLNSLILLLLSNSMTSRRDKSILYSRATMGILLFSAFIAYDNLFILFLAKGIGIFGGLFHTTATTIYLHIFIFLTLCVIVSLNSFHRFFRYQLSFVLFISSPSNIFIAISLFNIILYVLNLYYTIPSHSDIVAACSHSLSSLMLEYHYLDVDDFLINKMNRGDSHIPANGESPFNHEREAVYTEMVPHNPAGGFTSVNSNYYIEKLYDANRVRIRYLYYEKLVQGNTSKLNMYKVEDFDTNGVLCHTETL